MLTIEASKVKKLIDQIRSRNITVTSSHHGYCVGKLLITSSTIRPEIGELEISYEDEKCKIIGLPDNVSLKEWSNTTLNDLEDALAKASQSSLDYEIRRLLSVNRC